MITEAIILAGGLGTRLRNAVPDLPKCMAPVNGTPFLAFIIESLQNQGINKFIFSLGYKHEDIIKFLEVFYPNLNSECVIEETLLGTGGAVKAACSLVKNKHVVVVNGDSLFPVNLQQLYDFHLKNKADATIAAKKIKNSDRYGILNIEKSTKRIASFEEKKFTKEGYINAGIYILNVKSLKQSFLAEEIFSLEKDYLAAFSTKLFFYAKPFNSFFIDIGIPEDYKKFKQIIKLQQKKEKDVPNDSTASFINLIELIAGLTKAST